MWLRRFKTLMSWVDELIKMATLCLQGEEMLGENVQGFPVLGNKIVKGFRERDAVQNA